MDIQTLIRRLSHSGAYPCGADDLDVRQTHISVVFLAGAYAYKVKKPLNVGFLDFTTLDKRLHFCREEVRLNRRLAPDVYIGVVPIVESDGVLSFEGAGHAIEYAVKMRRLPSHATLLAHLEREEVGEMELAALGRKIAEFHAAAASGPEIDQGGTWEVVAGNARENLDQSAAHVGEALSEHVFTRLRDLLELRLGTLRPLIESRAAAHVPRDTHGDLHLQHVYLFPERAPPDDVVIIDCIEFNERFRFADPVADMAFTVMDLLRHGRANLSEHFADAYFRFAKDPEGRNLLRFYVAYRAAVRGKVEGMTARDTEIPTSERHAALRRARGHWLMTLGELDQPERRPCLVLVGGLPGTGKSTLARGLGRRAGFRVISSDLVRKELAGMAPDSAARAAFGEGIYTPEWNERTYSACLERAEALLFEGRRVVVDASFREAGRRQRFFDSARSWGVRSVFLRCSATPEVVRQRIDDRRGDPSDANWAVYQGAAQSWEVDDTDATLVRKSRDIATDEGPDRALGLALTHLREVGLWE